MEQFQILKIHQEPQSPPKTQRPKSTSKRIGIIICCLASILIIGVGVGCTIFIVPSKLQERDTLSTNDSSVAITTITTNIITATTSTTAIDDSNNNNNNSINEPHQEHTMSTNGPNTATTTTSISATTTTVKINNNNENLQQQENAQSTTGPGPDPAGPTTTATCGELSWLSHFNIYPSKWF